MSPRANQPTSPRLFRHRHDFKSFLRGRRATSASRTIFQLEGLVTKTRIWISIGLLVQHRLFHFGRAPGKGIPA